MTSTESPLKFFRALTDFFSDKLESQYVKGMTYTVRTPKLATLVDQWLASDPPLVELITEAEKLDASRAKGF